MISGNKLIILCLVKLKFQISREKVTTYTFYLKHQDNVSSAFNWWHILSQTKTSCFQESDLDMYHRLKQNNSNGDLWFESRSKLEFFSWNLIVTSEATNYKSAVCLCLLCQQYVLLTLSFNTRWKMFRLQYFVIIDNFHS